MNIISVISRINPLLKKLFDPGANLRAISELMSIVIKNGLLIMEMSKDNLTGRFKGQFFGAYWVVVHPVALTLLYLFLFAVVFVQRIGGTHELPLDYTAYILSGLIPWLTFQNSMTTSVMAITGNSNLVKQFVFPLEVLPIRDVVVSLLTWMIMTGLTLAYIVITQGKAMATWILLPFVLMSQTLAMIGVAFVLSSVAVFFRDIKDFVQLFCLVAIFIMPIVFLPGWVPKVFQPMLWINPFTYMIWVYQDVIYFGRFEHPLSWIIFFGSSMLVFLAGFRFFTRTKPMFGSLV